MSKHTNWMVFGLIIGNFIGMGILHIVEAVEVYNTPPEVVCQNGKTFQQATIGSEVYLKTETTCLEIVD